MNDSPSLRVLIACEFTGTVRREFDRLGHDAWSCDMRPAEDRSNRHITGDVRDVLDWGWDLPIKPMDVGGSNGSHHSYTLTKLVRLGLADHRKAGCDWGVAPTRYRGSKAYRPSDLGLKVWDRMKERNSK